jgi:hypothetical protein
LLDFRVTPHESAQVLAEAEPTLSSSQRWLADVAALGLGERFPVGLPLSARRFLDRLTSAGFTSSADIVATAREATAGVDTIEPWRRATAMLASGVTPVVFLLLGVLLAFILRQAPLALQGLAPDLKRAAALQSAATPTQVAEREALETFIAGSYASPIASELTWSSNSGGIALKDYRALAADIVTRHPHVTPEQLAAARTALGHSIDQDEQTLKQAGRMSSLAYGILPAIMMLVGFGLAAGWACFAAIMFRGGLVLRLLHLALVDGSGRQASRWRAGVRAFVAWLPVAVFLIGVSVGGFQYDGTYHVRHLGIAIAAVASLFVFLAGAAIAAFRPGIQDRIVHTQIVPR